MANSITISGVHAGYGSVRVLEDVSLDVRPAETVVLLDVIDQSHSPIWPPS